MKQHNLNQNKKPANKLAQAARYSGLAFEMFFIMLAGVFGGIKLDQKFNTAPLLTVILSLIAVTAALYIAIKDLLRSPKKNEKN